MKLRNNRLTFTGKWAVALGFAYACLAFGVFMASGCPQKLMQALQ